MTIYFDIEKVRKFIDEKNKLMINPGDKRKLRYSASSFARDNGINKQTFNSILIFSQMPGLVNAYKIAQGMELQVEDLLIIEK